MEISRKYCLAHSELLSIDFNNQELRIYLNSWEAKKLVFIFSNVLMFSNKETNTIDYIYESQLNRSVLEKHFPKNINSLINNKDYKLYQIKDHDYSALQIVAEHVKVYRDNEEIWKKV